MLENKVIVITVVFIFSSLRMKTKARTKGNSRKHSFPLGKTQSTIYGATGYAKLLSVSSHFQDTLLHERRKWGAFTQVFVEHLLGATHSSMC